MELPIELFVEDRRFEASMQSLSKFGALLRFDQALPVGAVVVIGFMDDGERVLVGGTIVARIDVARAARMGIAPGVAVRFAAGEAVRLARLGRACAGLEPPPPFAATRRMIQPVLSSLIAACTQILQPAPGKPILTGLLADIDVATLLTILERTQKTGRLLLGRRGACATIDFENGKITAVQATWDVRVRRILHDVLQWGSGDFELQSVTPPTRTARQSWSVTHVLLEHARLVDEGSKRSVASSIC